MKTFITFLFGMVCGALLLIGISFFWRRAHLESSSHSRTYLKEVGEVISTRNFRILQVTDKGDALAREESDEMSFLLVLFPKKDGQEYYDEQVLYTPPGKCLRQIGTYRYTSVKDIEKSIPIVGLYDLPTTGHIIAP